MIRLIHELNGSTSMPKNAVHADLKLSEDRETHYNTSRPGDVPDHETCSETGTYYKNRTKFNGVCHYVYCTFHTSYQPIKYCTGECTQGDNIEHRQYLANRTDRFH